MIKGIDVSRWQGNIDFNKVKASGVDFVIIKAGGSDSGFYTDKNFLHNVISAALAGLHIGAYYFVGKGCKSKDLMFPYMRFQGIFPWNAQVLTFIYFTHGSKRNV